MEHCFFNRYDFTIYSRARFHNLIFCVYGSISVIFRSYPNLIGCLIISVSICLLCRDFLIQKIGIGLSKILFCIRDRIKGNLAIQFIGLSLADGCFAFLHFFALQDKGKLSICKQTAGQILLSGKIQSSLCMVCIGKLSFLNFRLHRTACRTADLIDLCCCRQVSIPVIGNGYFYMVNSLIIGVTRCLFCRDFLIHQISISLSCICHCVSHLREGNASIPDVVLNRFFVSRCDSGAFQREGELVILCQRCSGQYFCCFYGSFTFCLIGVGEFQFRFFVVLFANVNIQCTVTVITYFYDYPITRAVIGITIAICFRCNFLNRIIVSSDLCSRVLDRIKFEASIFCVPCLSQDLAAFT